MEDQFLRRRRRNKDGLDKNQVKELIDKHQEKSYFLSLAKIDANEIVIFHDKQGRLAISDVKIGDRIRKGTSTINNLIAVYQDGKLRPHVQYDTIVKSITAKAKEKLRYYDRNIKYEL